MITSRRLPRPVGYDEILVAPYGEADRHRNVQFQDAIHEQRQKNKHVTLQLLWEEYRESNPDGYVVAQDRDLTMLVSQGHL